NWIEAFINEFKDYIGMGNLIEETLITNEMMFASTYTGTTHLINIDYVYPTLGITGESLIINVRGEGLDKHTRCTMYKDFINNKLIVGSIQTTGPAQRVAVSGNMAYVTNYADGFQVIDITEPSFPISKATLALPGNSTEIVLSGNFAYVVSDDSGLHIIDLKDSSNPTIITTVPPINYAENLMVFDNTAYVVNRTGLQIIDINQPEFPVVKNFEQILCKGIAIKDNYGFIVDGTSLSIYNLSNSENMLPVVSYNNLFCDVQDIKIWGNTAYVLDRCSYTRILKCIDISDLSNVKNLSAFELNGIVSGFSVIDSTAYIACGTIGIQIIDLADHTNPTSIGMVDTPDFALGVAIDNQITIIADRKSGLQIVNTRDFIKSFQKQFASLPIPDIVCNIAFSNGLSFIAGNDSGFYIFNAAQNKLIDHINTQGYARDVLIYQNLAYVADYRYGLQVIDTKNPESSSIVYTLETVSPVMSLKQIDSFLFLGTDAGLYICDLTVPEKPVIISSLSFFGGVGKMAVSGQKIFVINDYQKIIIIDIQNKWHPKIIDEVDLKMYMQDISISKSQIFLACVKDGFHIFDTSLNRHIGTLSNVEAKRLFIRENTAYIAEGVVEGLKVVDVSDPEYPVIVGSINLSDNIGCLLIHNNDAYFGGLNTGLQVFDIPILTEVFPQIVDEQNAIIELPAVNSSGHYSLRFFKPETSHVVSGAVTYVEPEESYLLNTKAIIVAGTKEDDLILEQTIKSANRAYDALIYQGYTHESIYYLSPEKGNERVDAETSYTQIEYAITTWPTSYTPTTDLTIFFVDHGGVKIFKTNINNKDLDVLILDEWLDTLQKRLNIPILFIYDACQSGSFLPNMPAPEGYDRIVITSAAYYENALFQNESSFSYQFFDAIYRGMTIGEAFDYAQNQVPDQKPTLDVDGDGMEDENIKLLESDLTVGREYDPGVSVPYIYEIFDKTNISEQTSFKIWANVHFPENEFDIQRVWAIITPPNTPDNNSDIPESNLPEIELVRSLENDKRFEAVYDQFIQTGTYDITVCAKNRDGYALFQNSSITKSNINIIVNEVSPLYGSCDFATITALLSCECDQISKVWAEIRYKNDTEIISVVMKQIESSSCVYEMTYNSFVKDGQYLVNILAKDIYNYTISSKSPIVIYRDSRTDYFEKDDKYQDAKIIFIDGEAKEHILGQNDQDWLTFYAIKNQHYTIEIDSGSYNIDISLYRSTGNTSEPEKITQSEDNSNLLEFCSSETNLYYIEINSSENSPLIQYKIKMYQPHASNEGTIRGTIFDAITNIPIQRAKVSSNKTGSSLTDENGQFRFKDSSDENFMLFVQANGYEFFQMKFPLGVNEIIRRDISLQPNKIISDINKDNKLDLSDVLLLLKHLSEK
ncbi:Peptidase C13, legumain, partial [Candidatus Magnetomorum sp. HK-1]